MYILVIIITNFAFLIKNEIVLNEAIAFLTKSYINNIFVTFLIVMLFIFKFFKKNKIIVFFLIIYLNFASINNSINIPLSNSLFLIHPIMLYFTIINIFFSCFLKKQTNKYNKLCLLLLTISLGGYWSLHEFSWGGWWNWDLLESLIFLNSFVYGIIIHLKNKSFRFFNKLYINFFFINLCYICYNKWGLSISIHNFIKSSFFKRHYYFYILLYVLYQIFFLKNIYSKQIQYVILIYVVYNSFSSLNFLKIIILLALISYFLKKNFYKKTLLKFIHLKWLYIYILIVLFNFNNNIILFNYNIDTLIYFNTNTQKTVQFTTIDDKVKYVYNFCGKFFFFKIQNNIIFNVWNFYINTIFKTNLYLITYFK